MGAIGCILERISWPIVGIRLDVSRTMLQNLPTRRAVQCLQLILTPRKRGLMGGWRKKKKRGPLLRNYMSLFRLYVMRGSKTGGFFKVFLALDTLPWDSSSRARKCSIPLPLEPSTSSAQFCPAGTFYPSRAFFSRYSTSSHVQRKPRLPSFRRCHGREIPNCAGDVPRGNGEN